MVSARALLTRGTHVSRGVLALTSSPLEGWVLTGADCEASLDFGFAMSWRIRPFPWNVRIADVASISEAVIDCAMPKPARSTEVACLQEAQELP